MGRQATKGHTCMCFLATFPGVSDSLEDTVICHLMTESWQVILSLGRHKWCNFIGPPWHLRSTVDWNVILCNTWLHFNLPATPGYSCFDPKHFSTGPRMQETGLIPLKHILACNRTVLTRQGHQRELSRLTMQIVFMKTIYIEVENKSQQKEIDKMS